MKQFDIFKSTPFGSLAAVTTPDEQSYFDAMLDIPAGMLDMLLSPKTGAYLRGMLKSYDVDVDVTPKVAFLILQISYGKQALAQLAQSITQALAIPPAKAQLMARDIEKDLFSSIMLELNAFLSQKNKPLPPSNTGGARNVLDLKQNKPSYPLPPRPR